MLLEEAYSEQHRARSIPWARYWLQLRRKKAGYRDGLGLSTQEFGQFKVWSGVSEVSQGIKILAAKSDDPDLIPRVSSYFHVYPLTSMYNTNK